LFITLTWKGGIAMEITKKPETLEEKLRRLCDADDASYEQSWKDVLKAYPWEPHVREARRRLQQAKIQELENKRKNRKLVRDTFIEA
jgi:hypothetical protein